jgi:hypothetical protein
MPECEVVARPAWHRLGVGVEHVVEAGGPDAEQQPRRRQDGRRDQECRCRAVHFGDALAWFGFALARERAVDEAQAVDRREYRAERHARQHERRRASE